MKEWIRNYINEYQRVIESIPIEKVDKLIKRLTDTLTGDTQIFVCGNGGSAANASHFVTDLGKGSSDAVGKRFKCISLNDNASWMTAIGTDYSYADVFHQQLINYAKPNDILIVLSVSGSSANVVKAVDWAKKHSMHTIALVGGHNGKLTRTADECIIIDSKHFGYVEDAQMTICHILCYAFMENSEIVTETR